MNDLISRQDAIKELEEQLYYNDADEGIIIHGTPFWNSDLVKGIIKNDVPSAEPKKGEWVPDGFFKDEPSMWKCSCCGASVYRTDECNYCYNCGAKMEKE